MESEQSRSVFEQSEKSESYIISKEHYSNFFSNLEKEMVIIPREYYQNLIHFLEDEKYVSDSLDSIEQIKKYVEEPENQWKRASLKIKKKITKPDTKDEIDTFISLKFERKKDCKVRMAVVYQMYEEWMDLQNKKEMGYFTFVKKMREKYLVTKVNKESNYLQGWDFKS
jgi:hypothetical protein